jgi:PAS domain S-box-containing protein
MGLVEQSQVVASTAVVVAMVTIVTLHFVIGRSFGWMDYLSLLTVGVIGFVSVFFSLKYGRMLEEQRKEIFELNMIGEAVNYSVELEYVLQSALEKGMEFMGADCGWIYLLENQVLTLKHRHGTSVGFFPEGVRIDDGQLPWLELPTLFRLMAGELPDESFRELKAGGVEVFASVPLLRQGGFGGVLIAGSTDERKFQTKKRALMQAFGNQISAALSNASLFDQIKQSERLYADLYENSPDMYHSVNRDGIVISCNRTESQLLGMPKERIVGYPLLNLYPVSEHEHIRENLRAIFERRQELKGVEEQIQRPDGSLIDVSVSTSLVIERDGRPSTARMVLRDITEKKRMEVKILQAQKIDSIGSLAGGIAHDFNNMLTAILGSASIMRRKVGSDEKWLKYVDLIETTSRRGASVTRQLLTFARKGSSHFEPVDVNIVIDQTIRLFEVTTPKTVIIRCTLSPERVIVQGNEGQLQQALLNLCLNARDAMQNGGVLVVNCRRIFLDEVHAAQFAEGRPGHYVMITVIDSGVGIPPQILNRIYEPFFTTKEVGKGTGLGLSVVYGVVRSHNGYISVNSETDSGTVFTIYLPESLDQNGEPIPKYDLASLPGGSERILLIEDEISVGEVGADILRDLGYTVDIAHNGREALQVLSVDPSLYQLIILDMNMPRLSGKATFEQMQRISPGMKVLVCSGYSAAMLEDENFARAIDGYLEKPYEMSEIARKIRGILDATVSHTT